MRRLERVDRLVVRAGAVESAGAAWDAVRRECGTALGALAVAVDAVPEADWVTDERRERLAVRELRLDVSAWRAWWGGSELTLARQEFGLLRALAEQPERVTPKAELLKRVWGYQSTPRTRTVDSHASRLRRKLLDAGASRDEWVINYWGVGYSLLRG